MPRPRAEIPRPQSLTRTLLAIDRRADPAEAQERIRERDAWLAVDDLSDRHCGYSPARRVSTPRPDPGDGTSGRLSDISISSTV
jgi:hypothetical protein